MSVVRSRFNRPVTIPVPEFSGFEIVYEERLDDGVRHLVKVNENPLNDFVQASLADTLIYNIIDKYQKGNLDVLNKTSGHFFDVTGFPTSLAEAQKQIIQAESFFGQLPLELRKEFDYSSSVFLSKIADGSAFEILKPKSDNEINTESEVGSIES